MQNAGFRKKWGLAPFSGWDQVLLFAFTNTRAIYTNTLLYAQTGSFYFFYKWTEVRGNLILKTGNIYVAFILVMKL